MLNAELETYEAVGLCKGECDKPYIVLNFADELLSVNNNSCGWQIVQIYCYTPLGDINVMDNLITTIKNTLKNKLEYAGGLTPEVVDEEKKAYLRKIKYRIPKEVI